MHVLENARSCPITHPEKPPSAPEKIIEVSLEFAWGSLGDDLKQADTYSPSIHRTFRVSSYFIQGSSILRTNPPIIHNQSHSTHMITNELQSKIDYSIRLIQRAESTALRYRPDGFFVAFSGGKDSQVLLRLVQMANVRYTAQHHLTTIDPPENIHFIKEHYPYVQIIRPKLTFWRLCLKYRMLPNRRMTFCCHDQKEQTNANSVTLTGVRKAESARRSKRQEVFIQTRRRHPEFIEGSMNDFQRYQETVVECIKGKDKLVIRPILEWTDEDIWLFIHHYHLPINPLYTNGGTRVGCLFCCLANSKNIEREVERYPKYYQAFLRLIHRIRQANQDVAGGDPWSGFTDAEVFEHWIHKRGPMKARQLQQSLTTKP